MVINDSKMDIPLLFHGYHAKSNRIALYYLKNQFLSHFTGN